MEDKNTSKPKLYLITTDFPFGIGEGSFILPELPYLMEKFDITIISNSLNSEQTDFLDEAVEVVHYVRKASLIQKVWDSLCYLGNVESYREIWDILKSGKNIFGKFFESILFFEEAKRFSRFIKKNHIIPDNQPVLVYCYWFTYYCFTMTEYSKSHPGIKVITRTHRYDLYDEASNYGRQPFKRAMNKRLHNIVFIAEHGRQYYINKYGESVIPGQYQLFRLGVQPAKSRKIVEKTENTFFLVSCAMVIPRKRIKLIVDALAMLPHCPIKWIHFGDGPDYEELCRYAEDKLLGKGNNTYELKGYVESEDIQNYYSENYIDAFITTTSSEGCPVSVQEAMSYGIPVIGTAIAEIPYMIEGNGILLKENPQASEVADAIWDMYNKNEYEIAAMREASVKLWRQNFNSEVNSKRFAEFLTKCYP